MKLRHLLCKNDGGIWGDDPTGEGDTVVLRSTEQTVLGGWSVDDPATRSIPKAEVERRLLEPGDLVVTKSSGSTERIGKASIVDDKMASLGAVFSNFNQRLRLHERESARYVWYLLNSRIARHHYVVHATSTSGLGNLTGTILGNLPVPITDLEIQKAIADFLDRETARIDQLVLKREAFLALIDEKESALSAKAINGAILRNVVAGKQGWFGTVPDDWPVRRGKFLFKERQDRSESGDEELLTVSHITGLTRRSDKDVNMFLAESMEGYKLVSQGDVVVNTMWAWMGAMGVSFLDGLISPSYGVYSPITDDFDPAYLDLLLRSRPFVAEVNRRSKGVWSSRLRLYPDAFLDIRFPVPTKETQGAILKTFQAALQRERRLAELSRQSLDRLREFRSALITAAVNGQVDVAKRGDTARRLDRIEEQMPPREVRA